MSSEQVRMSQPEIAFCFAIAQGKHREAKELLQHVNLIPKSEVKKPNPVHQPFNYSTALFCLWAYKQTEPQAVYHLLKQLFPKEAAQHVPFGVMPTSAQIQRLVQSLVFEPVKRDLLSFLFNIAQLEGSYESQLQRFYLITTSKALEVLVTDEFFNNIPARHLELAEGILDRLKTKAQLAEQFESVMSGMKQLESSTETPTTVKLLIQSLHAATDSSSRQNTFLPSRGLNRAMSCRNDDEEELRRPFIAPRLTPVC